MIEKKIDIINKDLLLFLFLVSHNLIINFKFPEFTKISHYSF